MQNIPAIYSATYNAAVFQVLFTQKCTRALVAGYTTFLGQIWNLYTHTCICTYMKVLNKNRNMHVKLQNTTSFTCKIHTTSINYFTLNKSMKLIEWQKTQLRIFNIYQTHLYMISSSRSFQDESLKSMVLGTL